MSAPNTASPADRIRACAFWNDEAGANAWNHSQHAKLDADRRVGEGEAARFWAQAKRLHAAADDLAALDRAA